MSRRDWRVGWEEGGKDRKDGIRDEPSRSKYKGKETSVVRGETKIRYKRSITVRFACTCRVNVSFERDKQFDYVYFSVWEK